MKASDALKHPNWDMGAKITIDSATLVNKGLEVMEACHLFGVGLDDITVVIHPQSVIHSAVQYRDGAIIAQLGSPDMRLPIQYALFYPRRPLLDTKRVDLFELASMTFEKPDPDRFPGFKYAFEAARAGGIMPTVFNAANEKAVALFLKGRIGFMDIPRLIRAAMDEAEPVSDPSVEKILDAETFKVFFDAIFNYAQNGELPEGFHDSASSVLSTSARHCARSLAPTMASPI